MSLRVLMPVLPLTLLGLLLACGDDTLVRGPDAGGTDAGVRVVGMPDAGPPAASAAGATTRQDGGSGFPELIGSLKSNTPGVRVEQRAPVNLRAVRLVSSNLERLDGGGLRWFGELSNGTREPWCDPKLEVSFRNSEGEALWQANAEPQLPLYQDGMSPAPRPCVGASEVIPVWVIDLEAPDFELERVGVIGLVTRGESVASAVPHSATPSLDGARITSRAGDGGAQYGVSGALVGHAQPVTYAAVEVFVKNAEGLVFEVLRASVDVNGGRLSAGEAWSFQTATTPQPIESFQVLTSFVLE